MSRLSEQSIITLFQQTDSPNPFDNDAAVVYHDGTMLTTSQDTLNEHTHFKLAYCPPEAIAQKCLTANLSDMAAMGLTGHYLLQSLSMPAHTPNTWIKAYAAALNQQCAQANIKLIGGDTTRLQDHVSISMTIMDVRAKQRVLTRTGIQPGDNLFISKPLGAACAGLHALQHQKNIDPYYLNAFLYPQAERDLGQWLGAQAAAHACMDLTDGLAQDLTRLCHLNQLSVTVNIDDLPQRHDWAHTCQTLDLDPIITLLTGGEDFALLVTGTPDLAKISNGQLHPIGHFHKTQTTPTINWRHQGQPFHLTNLGFKHF
jgi:thiamine-monophosphate kinase